jgi:carbon-monoxide dehydrogenase large subunit
MRVAGPGGSFGVGQPVRRVEDRRLVAGAGRFADDATRPGMVQAYVLRAPHAHARILHIEGARARKAKGVRAVLTAAELEREGVKPIPSFTRLPASTFPNRDGTPLPDPPYYPLARGKVRFGGEAVAFVVAATRDEAQDAAARIAVAHEPLAAVTDSDMPATPEAVWRALRAARRQGSR